MVYYSRSAKVNVKVLVILVSVAVVLAVGASSAYFIRRHLTTKWALARGQEAFNRGQWAEAKENFGIYLSRNADDAEVWEKRAQASLNIHPMTKDNVVAAASAYRREVIRLRPDYHPAYQQLARIYGWLDDSGELGYMAKMWLEQEPDDAEAGIWLARSLMSQNKAPAYQEADKALRHVLNTLAANPDERFNEFAEASALLSELVLASDATDARTRALGAKQIADKAIEYDPTNPAAWVLRAGILRGNLAPLGMTDRERIAAAAQDLNANLPFTDLDGHYDELAQIAANRLAVAPDNARAAIWLVRALLAQDNAPRAEEVLADTLGKLDPNRDAEYVAAIGILRSQAKQTNDPHSSVSVQRLDFGRIRPAMGRLVLTRREILDAAVRDLTQAHQLDTENPLVLNYLIGEWSAHNLLDRASAEVDRAGSLNPEKVAEYIIDPDQWLGMRFSDAAGVAKRKGRPRECLSLADQVLRDISGIHRPRVLPVAIDLYVAAGQAEQAYKALGEYLDILRAKKTSLSTDPTVAILQARVLRIQDDPDKWPKIIAMLQPFAAAGTGGARLHRFLADAYSNTNQPRLANRELAVCFEQSPGDLLTARQLILEYRRQQRWSDVERAARMVEQIDPASLPARLWRIEAQIIQAARRANPGELAKLTAELETLGAQQPDVAEIHSLRALSAAFQRDSAKAEAILQQAISRFPEETPLRLQLGRVLYGVGPDRIPEAVTTFAEAARLDPNSVEAWRSQAKLLEFQGEPDQARQTMARGIEAATDASAKRQLSIQLSLLDIRTNRRSEGLDALKKLAKDDPRDLEVLSLLLKLPKVLTDEPMAQGLVDQIKQIQGETGRQWQLEQARVWMASPNWPDRQSQIENLLNTCLVTEPGWSDAALLLGALYERMSQPDNAEIAYRNALEANPDSIEVINRLVVLLQKQGQYQQASDVLRLFQANPQVAQAMRIRLAIGGGNIDEAISELRGRTAENPSDTAAMVQLAYLVYTHERNVDEALRLLDQAQVATPAVLLPTAYQMLILRNENRQSEIEPILTARVETQGSFGAYFLRAAYLTDAGNIQEAQKDYDQLIALGEGGAGYEAVGALYASLKRNDDALAIMKTGIDAFPQNNMLKLRYMQVLISTGAPDNQAKAMELLAELEQRQPNDTRLALFHIGVLLKTGRAEDIRQASLIMGRLVRVNPVAGNSTVFIAVRAALAGRMYTIGEVDRADQMCQDILKVDPNNVQSLNDLAWIRANNHENYEAALALADKGVRLAPDNNYLRDTRGYILMHLPGRLAKAQQDFQKCLDLAGEDLARRAKAHANLGRVAMKLGQPASARDHFQQALKYDDAQKTFAPPERQEVEQMLGQVSTP